MLRKSILFLPLVALALTGQNLAAFQMPEPEEYFKKWIIDYRSIVSGKGPVPVEIIDIKSQSELIVGKSKNYDSDFKQENNQSAVVLKNGRLIYETYNSKWDGSINNLIHGQSMTKTVTGLTIGALICSGQIVSIEDPLGKYSTTLKNTPYADISIKKALQMRSGINVYDPEGTWKIWGLVTGDNKLGFSGKNYLRKYIQTIKSANGNGDISEYHPHDSHALSILASDLTSKSLGRNFYELIFGKINPRGRQVWMTDADGVTIPSSGLFLQARDWAKIGKFIIESIRRNDCMGQFLQDGVSSSSRSSRLESWKYGYHFWTYDGLIILAGYGGQTMFINPEKGSVVMASSVHPKYGYTSVFRIAADLANE